MLCSAYRWSDERIGENRFTTRTQLLLVLQPTHFESLVRCTVMQVAVQHRVQCPVAGCGAWKGNENRRSNPRWWYPVESNKHLLAGKLDQSLSTLPCNDHICPKCYLRFYKQWRQSTRNLLDELSTAALDNNEPGTPPPSSPSPQLPPPSPSSPPPTLPPPAPPPPPPSPPPPPPLPVEPVRRALSDITNLVNRSPRRISTTLARKQQTLSALAKATTSADKQAVLQKAGIPIRHSSKYISRYRKALEVNQAAESGEQRPLTARRLSGAGRPTVLTYEQELELRAWVMDQRRSKARSAVSEVMVRMEASRRWDIKASSPWVRSWMKRHGLTMRLRTTHKELTTERMIALKADYQNKCAIIFNTYPPKYIYNTDETSVYFDAPHNRTIDEVGARSVEIGHTDHWADRISISLCVNYAGELLPPLVLFRCHETKKMKKTGTFSERFIDSPKGGHKVPGVLMWITHKKVAWFDSELMCRWYETVYAGGLTYFGRSPSESVLFMDGCGAHHTEEVEKVAAGLGVRVETLPPNTTPILQPCDQYVNSLFKKYYQEEWREWYVTTGYQDATKKDNKHSNLRRAREQEVIKWIANATARLILSPLAIRRSWDCTLIVSKPHIMHMPPPVWNVLRLMMQHEEWRETLDSLNIVFSHHKSYGTKFNIPVTKRKRKQPGTERNEGETNGKEGKEEAAIGDGGIKEKVVVRVSGQRYPAEVDAAVVAAIKRRRVDSDRSTVKSVRKQRRQQVSQQPQPRQPERPFRIRQPWET